MEFKLYWLCFDVFNVVPTNQLAFLGRLQMILFVLIQYDRPGYDLRGLSF